MLKYSFANCSQTFEEGENKKKKKKPFDASRFDPKSLLWRTFVVSGRENEERTQMVLRRPEDCDSSENKKIKIRGTRNGRLFVGTDVFRVLSCCVGAVNLCISLALHFFLDLLVKYDSFSVREGWTLPRSSVQGEAAIELRRSAQPAFDKTQRPAKILLTSLSLSIPRTKKNKKQKCPVALE